MLGACYNLFNTLSTENGIHSRTVLYPHWKGFIIITSNVLKMIRVILAWYFVSWYSQTPYIMHCIQLASRCDDDWYSFSQPMAKELSSLVHTYTDDFCVTLGMQTASHSQECYQLRIGLNPTIFPQYIFCDEGIIFLLAETIISSTSLSAIFCTIFWSVS